MCAPLFRLIVVALALAIGCSGCNVQTGIDGRGDLQITGGKRAPALEGDLIGGGRFDMSAQMGHAVVVDFWGPWCGPCRQEQADLNGLHDRYAGRGVVFVGVAMRTGPAEVQAYRAELGMVYPSVLDDGSRASDWSVSAPPTLILVNGKGQVVQSFLGTVAGASDVLDAIFRQAR